MTKRSRTTLFVLIVILFFLAAPTLILYSQGYRFDFNPPAGGKRIVQTGGLYLKVAPRGVQVYINGTLKNETSVFSNSSLIKNLIPKTYNIEVKKEGYYSWQKNLDVEEKRVTEAKNITLFPQDLNFLELNATSAPDIAASATSSDQEKVLKFNNHEIWISFAEKQSQQPSGIIKEEIFLMRFSEKICQALWLNDYYIIFAIGETCSKIKVAEIDDRDKLNVIDLAQFPAPQIFFDQKTKNLYVWSEKTLYLAENLLP